MPPARLLVLDANILIRAVLGKRVRAILLKHGRATRFVAPEAMVAEAEEHLPALLSQRGVPTEDGMDVLNAICKVIQIVDHEAYSAFEETAKLRLAQRDIDDWPVLAAALVLNCPIWTEDADFFGAGVATWTTDRVEMYLENAAGS